MAMLVLARCSQVPRLKMAEPIFRLNMCSIAQVEKIYEIFMVSFNSLSSLNFDVLVGLNKKC